MIKAKNGTIEITGYSHEIATDLLLILLSVYKTEPHISDIVLKKYETIKGKNEVDIISKLTKYIETEETKQ